MKGGDFLNKVSLETTDLFRGAFFMCMGGDLKDIRFQKNGKQIASFLFTARACTDSQFLARDGQDRMSSNLKSALSPPISVPRELSWTQRLV